VSYHPFDPDVLDKYVVGDEYLPIWKLSTLKDAFRQGFSMKEVFDSFVRRRGKEPVHYSAFTAQNFHLSPKNHEGIDFLRFGFGYA
jgi:hypothetical protein